MKVLKVIGILIVILFFCLFFANSTGYYEYKLSKKTTLTSEAIAQFEQDIKDGKSVDVKDYITDDKKNYDNSVSNLNRKVSNSISKVFGGTLKYLFKYVNRVANE